MTTPNRFTREGFIQAQEVIAKAAEEKAAQRQHAKQKLTARERLALFFDDGVWHEVGQFIGGSVREGRVGSAVAAGYGRVQGPYGRRVRAGFFGVGWDARQGGGRQDRRSY